MKNYKSLENLLCDLLKMGLYHFVDPNKRKELVDKIINHPNFSLEKFIPIIEKDKPYEKYSIHERNNLSSCVFSLWWRLPLEEQLTRLEKSFLTMPNERTCIEILLISEVEIHLNIPSNNESAKIEQFIKLLNLGLYRYKNVCIPKQADLEQKQYLAFQIIKAALTDEHPVKVFFDKIVAHRKW